MAENRTIFETVGSDDPLGLWASVPAPSQAGIVHFGIGDEEPAPLPETPVFRVNLPTDLAASQAALDSSQTSFAQVNSALDGVSDRLSGLVSRQETGRQPQAGESGTVSFAAPTLEPESGPEGDLLSLLEDAESEAAAEKAPAEVHFGIAEPVSEKWLEAKARFDALIQQIDREVLHFVWVETNIGGRLIGRTSMDWSGDAHTIWKEGVSVEQMRLHHRSLKIATETRNLRLRLFVTVASGAAKVAGLMATPGGAILALPAVYQYVTKIMAQAKQLQSIQS